MKKNEINNDIEKKYDVSVIVATYNPKIDKLFYTLDSLINQKYVNMEIIVTDDGSANNLFNDVLEYFENHNFKNYMLLEHKKNSGTVLNIYDGLKHSNGTYIKVLSPGDALCDEYILFDWIKHLKKSNRKWSFSDAYYKKNGKELELCSELTNPHVIDVYKKKNDKKSRINYLLYNDLALGAAILCSKDVMEEYIEKIKDRVIYAEDNIYRLMMFNNIVADYYPEKAIFYEYGDGISTSGNKSWSKKLRDDFNNTNKIMKEIVKDDDLFQKKIISIYEKKSKKKIVLEYYFSLSWICYFAKSRIIKRKTSKKIERRNRNASN